MWERARAFFLSWGYYCRAQKLEETTKTRRKCDIPKCILGDLSGMASIPDNITCPCNPICWCCTVQCSETTIPSWLPFHYILAQMGQKKHPPKKKKKNIHTCTNGWCRIFSSRKLKFADRSVVLTGLFASQSQSTYRYLGCAIYFYRIKINIWTFNIKM